MYITLIGSSRVNIIQMLMHILENGLKKREHSVARWRRIAALLLYALRH